MAGWGPQAAQRRLRRLFIGKSAPNIAHRTSAIAVNDLGKHQRTARCKPSGARQMEGGYTANYKQVMLGGFNTKDEASAVYEHAMGLLADTKTPKECQAALDKIIQHRRKRVAWERLQRSGRRHEWSSFEQFFRDVGYVDADESTVAALDESRPIGSTNFRWLLRPKGRFDRSTKDGSAAYARAYREANPGRWRHAHFKNNYGIDEIEYHRMLKENGDHSFICNQEPAQGFVVDHNHDTEELRGLLCKQCNYAMGQFGDDPERLRRATEFLELRDRSKRSPDPSVDSR
jgi:hypothetical protein